MPDLPISGLPAITVPNNSYLLAAVSQSVTAQMSLTEVAAAISSSFTASYYNEVDPVFVAKSASLATTGSNLFIGDEVITGSLSVTGSLGVSGSVIIVNNITATRAIFSDSNSNTKIGAGGAAGTGSNNLTIGDFTLGNNGNYNIAVGKYAQTGIISGSYNTSIGYRAGGDITVGSYNTILGAFTGSSTLNSTIVLADGQGNVGYKFSGSKAEITGSLNVSGSITAVNTIIANRASILDANYNTIVGGGTAISGYDNTALGLSALGNGSVGIYNVAVGDSAQAGVQSGSYNVSLGAFALEGFPIPLGASSGSYNTAIGTSAMQNLGQGSYNVALGLSALQGRAPNTGSASYNIAIGVSASFSASSAINNTTIGYRAGANITTGSYNTIIGSFTGSSTLANNVVLADGQGQVRYQWNGSTNGFTGSISQTSVTSSLIKADANGQLVAAVGGTDYTPPAYLSAYHTASLSVVAANTPSTMSFSTTDFSYGGVTISGSYSDKIEIGTGGIYNLQFSAQTNKTTGTSSTVYIWLAKNGTEVANSNTGVTMAGGANDVAIAAWNFYVSASAGDYYQLMFAATQANSLLQYQASGSVGLVGPAVPSVILTVNRIA